MYDRENPRTVSSFHPDPSKSNDDNNISQSRYSKQQPTLCFENQETITMDAYEESGRRGKTSLSAFADEFEGELEKISVCGVYLTRRVVLSVVGVAVTVGVILGVSIASGPSSMDKPLFAQDHKFWKMGQLIESATGKGIYVEGSSKYQALAWLADKDPKHLDETSHIEEVLQRFVLADLYFSTSGDEWAADYHWLSHKNVCDWNDKTHGVFCNENKQITALSMPESHLYGTIPQDIGLLSNMETINMSKNRVAGTIPKSIGIMSSLTELDLSMNSISGSIPGSFAKLQGLVNLDLSFNSLTGASDVDLFGDLPNLEELKLAHNEMSGYLGQIGADGSLHVVDLSYNNFDGIPVSKIPDGNSIQILKLNNNSIKGTVPANFGKLTQLLDLDMSENDLTGSLPTNIGEMTSLEILKLNNNEIAGALPTQMGFLYRLKVLELTTNLIEAMPTEFFNLRRLQNFAINENGIEGPLPSEIGLLTNLVYLDVSNNWLSEKLPKELSNLTNLNYLFLNINHFGGEVPSEIGGLSALKELDISDTDLFGDMGPQFCSSGNPIEMFKANCLLSEVDLPCATHCCDREDNCCPKDDPDCKPEDDGYDV